MEKHREIASYLAMTAKNKKIVLFDGVCNLCSSAVQFIINHDKKDIFRFVSLQSDLGVLICKHLGISFSKMDSIILYDPKTAYFYKSSAIIEIAKNFGGLWKLTPIFRIVPIFISDRIYDYVAKNRYNWYGKKESCMIPTPELKAKFL
ncbi:thiol-disulfide oxidoreductase DCC family protein [Flavobacterium sp. KACC 22763]|uniref:thiol-disulfide oxidoreductase DCC family protein n=1 Tax=Flavobacterium sp. KACC 22763 TaxID=3025668 RepID=UPI0023656B4B|nr:thiol-disulfide oxidoreductase DCC family protein [Flavobacterium sp. KACC 22763]WDF65594.1 thiol-disulfide oxidoreductase DCC family protein [Flavobacterium sp. KACC 22763]